MMNLEKSIWTEEGFENMEWRDCNIYGMTFAENYEFF